MFFRNYHSFHSAFPLIACLFVFFSAIHRYILYKTTIFASGYLSIRKTDCILEG